MRRLPLALVVLALCLASSVAQALPREIQIAYLMRLDWESDYPECMTCFTAHSAVPGDWTVTHEAIDLALLVTGERSISDFELAIMTGHEVYNILAEEREILEDFVDGGGILWMDDCGAIEIDNIPFGMEIDFGYPTYSYWGTCFGDMYTILEPDHPLMHGVYNITTSIIRNDVGLVDAQWFTPFVSFDAGYTQILSGYSTTPYAFSGTSIIAARVGAGAMVATAMDITCALECVGYVNPERPLSDYYFVINMLGWHDEDRDSILDGDEGEFDTTAPDTDGDTIPDCRDTDTDGDTVRDEVEGGDDDLDTPPVDTDGDTIPDFRDTDSDGDGIDDGVEERADSDGDGIAEPDADGDGIPNRLDPDSDDDSAYDAVEGDGDRDGDGIPNFVDENDMDGPDGDIDGDGVPNGIDNCPTTPNPMQDDTDGDTIGDACDESADPHDASIDIEYDVSDDVPADDASDWGGWDQMDRAKGCGCRMAGAGRVPAWQWLVLAAAAIALARRRHPPCRGLKS